MNILPVVNQIAMLFLIMGVGLLLRKIGVFKDAVIKGMNALLINVTWPALMIVTTQKEYTSETLHNFLFVLAVSIVIMSVGSSVCYFLFRRRNKSFAPVMALLCAMPNAGFFGIPIIEAMFGDIGLLYLSAYVVGFNITAWTLGVSIYTGFNLKSLKNLLNPGLICAAIGIGLFLLAYRLPTPVYSALSQLAAINTPLSMLILGARMDTLRPRMLIDSRLWIIVLVKLIAMPVLVLFALRLMGVSGMPLVLLTVSTAMPSAAAVQMMTERFGGDTAFSAKATSVSTLCSIATLPLILWIIGLVG